MPVATLTLLPAAPTATSLPPTVSPTGATLPGPQDVVTISPTARVSVETPADPVAAQLAALVRRRLAEALDLPEERIRLTSIKPYTWTDSSLGCPAPGRDYVPVVIEGYRIEASAGGQVYVFHTDWERITPCELRQERLPE